MDLLKLYNQFSLLTLAASLLAILGLRIATGSTSHQIKLIREFRATMEQTSRNCLRARTTALELEYDISWCHSKGNVLAFPTDKSGRRYVEESDHLIRTLATLTAGTGDMRVSHLRRSLRVLKRVDADCLRLLTVLEAGRI